MGHIEPDTGGKVIPLSGARRHGLAERTDDELMELAAADLREAMTELLRRYHQRVRSYCRKWNPEHGDDLAQDVFLQLWKARASYRPAGQFPVYLFTLVRNRCRNDLRQWFRRPALAPIPAHLSAAGSDQLDRLLEAERNRRANQEVTALSPKLREAVLLRFGEGLSYAEISRIVGAGEVTVRSRVHLGVTRLRQSLGDVP